MSMLFSTNSVAARDRFAYWREAICDSYVLLDCDCDHPADFGGEINLNRLSRLSTSFVSGSSQHVTRRMRDISRSNEEYFLVSLQLARDGIIRQAGREALLHPGDFALYSSVDRYGLQLPDNFRQLVVQIPRRDLLDRLPNADVLTGTRVAGTGVLGSVVRDSVLRLVSALDQSRDAVRHCVQETIIDLFVTGLASLEGSSFELSQPEQQLLMRADTVIRSNLGDPDFDRSKLAAAMGMSVRRLSEVYQGDGRSISSTIRRMRLRNIAADLRDARFARRSIADIAYRWGIDNQQNLVRLFRAEYGMSPREYRNQQPA